MTKREIGMEIKASFVSEEGSFEGLLSPYGGKPDSYGDIVEPGAYTKTLKDHGNKVPLLWQHKADEPVGELTLEDRPEGLWCKGQLQMALQEAQEVYIRIKGTPVCGAIVKGLSIGYETIKDSVENGVRHLKEIRLYEGSIVTFPASVDALIAAVKARKEEKDDFNAELMMIQLQDAGFQMLCALRCALGDLVWEGTLTRDQKIAAAGVTIQQFTDAYMAYFPPFLDMMAEMYGGMEMMAAKRLEAKSGRVISLANKEAIKSIAERSNAGVKQIHDGHEEVMAANEELLALIADEAATAPKAAGTPTTKAATKSEPVPDHSALFQAAKESFTWNHSSSK